MKHTKTYQNLLFLLPLLMSALACTLTAKPAPTPQGGAAAMVAQNIKPTQDKPQSISPAPTPTPQTCQVKTGLPEGRLNLRACGDVYCPVLAIVNEGETLTLTQPQAVNGWLTIKTAGGLIGWVNPNYTNCHERKTK